MMRPPCRQHPRWRQAQRRGRFDHPTRYSSAMIKSRRSSQLEKKPVVIPMVKSLVKPRRSQPRSEQANIFEHSSEVWPEQDSHYGAARPIDSLLSDWSGHGGGTSEVPRSSE